MTIGYNKTVKGEVFHSLHGFLISYKSFLYRGFSFSYSNVLDFE